MAMAGMVKSAQRIKNESIQVLRSIPPAPPLTNSLFSVYVLQSGKSGRYYVGCTQDVAARITQHNAGMTRSTKPGRPWRLVHSENYPTLSLARQRESQIKSWKSPAYMRKVLGLTESRLAESVPMESGR